MEKNTPIIKRIVLKLGGSIITKKDSDSFPTDIEEIRKHADDYIRYDVIGHAAQEIADALDSTDPKIEIIIVNGVGPFGHFLAKHGQPKDVINESCKILNDKIVSEFAKRGIGLVPVPPHITCRFESGEFDITQMWNRAKEIMKHGDILSTYGNIMEGKKIMSGDDLVVLLAKAWQAGRIISATDVDGVFTKNPAEHDDAKLVKRLDLSDTKVKVEYSRTKTDMTGEMSSKVGKLGDAAKSGISCQIVNGFVEGNVKAALLGDETIGTMIVG
jgi:isopentenyl phosphate kinase